MIKIHYLGTCSGTEPMKDMHHTSTVLEVDGALYWFDAGEGCAHTAYTMGLDVMNAEAIFISHPHIDHIGGMANLLFLFDKLIIRNGLSLAKNNTLLAFLPNFEIFEAIKLVALSGRIKRDDFKFNLCEKKISEGVIFEDERIRVIAKGNEHIPRPDKDSPYSSFSFLVEVGGKKIIFSGDLKSQAELDVLTDGGADVLIMETGHHKVSDVCDYAASHNIKNLRFIHHGREILGDRVGAETFVSEYEKRFDLSIKIARDATSEEF